MNRCSLWWVTCVAHRRQIENAGSPHDIGERPSQRSRPAVLRRPSAARLRSSRPRRRSSPRDRTRACGFSRQARGKRVRERSEPAASCRTGRTSLRCLATHRNTGRVLGSHPLRCSDVFGVLETDEMTGQEAERPKTILVVEDNVLNMKLWNDLLEAQGYQLFTVRRRSGWKQ